MAPRDMHRQRTSRSHGPVHGHVERGHYGNPADLKAFIRRQMDPGRARWQQPDVVVRALGLQRGQVVADIGAGPGFFTVRLARAVGPTGQVFAVDPESAVLGVLRERLKRSRVQNVTPVLARADDPMLPAGRCDLALVVNAYHHIPDGPAFLRRLAGALTRDGRIVNIDFDRRETPVGPPVEHRIARERFLRHAERAGLVLVTEHRFLPYQYFLVLRPRNARSPAAVRPVSPRPSRRRPPGRRRSRTGPRRRPGSRSRPT